MQPSLVEQLLMTIFLIFVFGGFFKIALSLMQNVKNSIQYNDGYEQGFKDGKQQLLISMMSGKFKFPDNQHIHPPSQFSNPDSQWEGLIGENPSNVLTRRFG